MVVTRNEASVCHITGVQAMQTGLRAQGQREGGNQDETRHAEIEPRNGLGAVHMAEGADRLWCKARCCVNELCDSSNSTADHTFLIYLQHRRGRKISQARHLEAQTISGRSDNFPCKPPIMVCSGYTSSLGVYDCAVGILDSARSSYS